MRGDVQDIFKMTPHDKQVMMFSATLSKEIRPICKKFMSDVSAAQQTRRRLPRRSAADVPLQRGASSQPSVPASCLATGGVAVASSIDSPALLRSGQPPQGAPVWLAAACA